MWQRETVRALRAGRVPKERLGVRVVTVVRFFPSSATRPAVQNSRPSTAGTLWPKQQFPARARPAAVTRVAGLPVGARRALPPPGPLGVWGPRVALSAGAHHVFV